MFVRLEELEFEVTDRLSMFLCGRKPEHTNGTHFLIPELATQANENIKQFRRQLQTTSCVLFEKLIQDVYDEIDRRETNAQWTAVQTVHNMGLYDSKHVAVFLPVRLFNFLKFLSKDSFFKPVTNQLTILAQPGVFWSYNSSPSKNSPRRQFPILWDRKYKEMDKLLHSKLMQKTYRKIVNNNRKQ